MRHHYYRTRAACLAALSIGGLLAGCSDGPLTESPPPFGETGLSLSSMTSPKIATVGSRIQVSVKVRRNGMPARGVLVNWQATRGYAPGSSLSDSLGTAVAIWEMPRGAGPLTLTSSVTASPDSRVVAYASVVATADTAMHIVKRYGDGAERSVNSCYRLFELAVTVTDAFDNVLPAASALWQIVDGPVAAGPGSSQQGPVFVAQSTPGVARVRATIRSGAFAEFTLTVLPPRYEVALMQDDYGGDPYFQSSQTCLGYDAPPVDTVPAGGTVTWHNYDYLRLQLFFFGDAPVAVSPIIEPWDKYSLVFTKPGTYQYADAKRPGVKGTIVVQ